MNNWEGNTLLYQSAGTDSQHRTFLPVPPPSDQHVNRALKVSHSPTSAPPSLTISLWTQRSTRGLGTGKAASTLARLTARVWTSPKLSVKTKMAVYNACVISTLLYGSETWTTYAGQERRLNTFHLRSIRRILGICWQDKVTNADVFTRAGLPTIHSA